MKSKLRLILTLSLFLVFLLAACDGGGGSNDPTATVVEPAAISSPVSEATATSEPEAEESEATATSEPKAEEAVPTEEEIDY